MNKIIYLDAAASAQKTQAVIEAEVDFLKHHYANTGRGICARSAAADEMLAASRGAVAEFIGAAPHQIVFTSGTTDAMNRVARMLRDKLGGARVAVSDLDHHSARMPFSYNADVCVMPLDENYNYDLTRAVAADVMVITAMSNVLGRAQDVRGLIAAARKKNPNVITVVDAAQYVAHGKIDVAAWDCDFLCFSGHKIGADTGLGVMYIKNPDDFYPDKFGGGMVAKIDGDAWRLEGAPARFEAGTLPLTQIAGLPVAIDTWRAWRGGADIVHYLYDELRDVRGVRVLTSRDAAMFTFTIDGMHPLDVGAMMGARGICVRAGNMCASWIHAALGLPGTVRISAGPWNTTDDAAAAVHAIKALVK